MGTTRRSAPGPTGESVMHPVANRHERPQPTRLARSVAQADDSSRPLQTRTDVRARRIPNLIHSLRADYPAVRRLLGEDSFRRVAHGFAASGSARAVSAPHLAEAFPHYLRTLGRASSIEYVADVADLEAAR